MAYSDQEIQQRASQMVGAGAAPDQVRQFIETAKAEQGQQQAPAAMAAQPAPVNDQLSREQLTTMARDTVASATPQGAFITNYGDTIKSAAIQGGPPAVGQALGAPLAPFTYGMAPSVFGAVGGLGGYLADSYRTDTAPTWGGAAAATVAGAIPGMPMAKGGMAIAKEAARQGVVNLGAAQIQKGIDEQKLLSGSEALATFATGAAGDIAMRGVGKAVGAGTKTMPLKPLEETDTLRVQWAKEMRKRGGAIPPRELGRGSELVGSIAEQASTYQAISRQNAPIIQQMMREDLELPGQGPIKAAPPVGYGKSQNDIKDYIARQYEPYESAKKYGFSPDERKAADIKKRQAWDSRQTNANWKQEYDAAQEAIDGWETAVEKAAKAAGDDTLIPRFRRASANIARAYAIDAATSRSTGYVDPSVLGAMVENDIPLSGNARLVADFYNSFPKAATDITRMPPPGSKGMGANVAWLAAAEGNPSGWGAAISRSKAGEVARNYITSDAAQNRFLAPRPDWNIGANAVSQIPLYGIQGIGRNVFLNREKKKDR